MCAAGQVNGRADEAVAGQAGGRAGEAVAGQVDGRGQAMLVRIGVGNGALG